MAVGLLALCMVAPSWVLPAYPVSPMRTGQGWRELFVRAWVSADLLGVVGVLWLGRGRWPVRVAASGWVCFAVAYEIYEVGMLVGLRRRPVLWDDVLLLPDLLNLVLDLGGRGVGLLLGGATALLCLCVILSTAVGVLGAALGTAAITRRRHIGAALMMVAVLGIHLERGLDERDSLVQSTALRLAHNLSASWSLRQSVAAEPDPPQLGPAAVAALRLRQRPPVYLFVIESYGGVLWDDPALAAHFSGPWRALGQSLEAAGWRAASTRSQAPVRGGLSWLSSATLLSGTHVASQHAFVRRMHHAARALPGAFAALGYRTVAVAAANRERPGRPLANPYGYDETLYFDELSYTGPAYGWGVVPDQFSLGRLDERSRQARPEGAPTFSYFATVSSHAPWEEIPPVVGDWRTLIERPHPGPGLVDRIATKVRRRFEGSAPPDLDGAGRRYTNAVLYDLEVIRDFLVSSAPPESLVVLVGDHQPPILPAVADDATPLQILSRDAAVVQAAVDRGLTAGIDPGPATTLRHQDVAALLAGLLDAAYGDGSPQAPLPPGGAPTAGATAPSGMP